MTRRGFIAGASAVALPVMAAPADGSPLLRFGVMTDTHVTRDPGSFDRVKLAFRTFRTRRCEMFCHLGDLAEECDAEVHRMWRRTVDEAWPGGAPRQLYVYAAHDVYNYRGKRWKLSVEDRAKGYESFRVNAGLPNGMYTETDVKGFPFIAVPQHVERRELEAMIERAEAKYRNGPVFVLNHVAPENTTFNSSDWGCWWTKELLSGHPRTVNFSGHTHGSLANERNIWQGGFTSVDAGCLSKWKSALPGTQSKVKESYEVLVCEVFADRMVLHRVDVRDGEDIRAPWTVPLPHDPADAPYSGERRRALAPKVEFSGDARLGIDVETDPGAVVLSFPAAESADDVFCYRIEAAKRGVLLEWETLAREDVYGEFYLRRHERKGKLECVIRRSSLNRNRPCRFTVTPVGFYGQRGRAIEADVILR